ncbi:hypothetical protein CLV81_2005 [Flagellimonas meridianipacifica]|uniref:Uncharacterized protein n=1 Tax=Flagellimonas meridianipacifica TaxID=1080225 RepID=A0A2T0M803_9FLAO|nr:hypothetical protein CLV81_2005 [Allomuricauda pacifica]
MEKGYIGKMCPFLFSRYHLETFFQLLVLSSLLF